MYAVKKISQIKSHELNVNLSHVWLLDYICKRASDIRKIAKNIYESVSNIHKRSLLQVCCSVLQGVAGCCRVLQDVSIRKRASNIHSSASNIHKRSMLQVCCSVSQGAARCCRVLQGVAVILKRASNIHTSASNIHKRALCTGVPTIQKSPIYGAKEPLKMQKSPIEKAK